MAMAKMAVVYEGKFGETKIRVVVTEGAPVEITALHEDDKKTIYWTAVMAERIDLFGTPSWVVEHFWGYAVGSREIAIEALVDLVGRPEWDGRRTRSERLERKN